MQVEIPIHHEKTLTLAALALASISAAQNVGIGTASPAAKLDIESTGAVPGLEVTSAAASSSSVNARFVTSSGATLQTGIENVVSGVGNGAKVGLSNTVTLNNATTGSGYGIFNGLDINGSATWHYGLLNSMTDLATGGTGYGTYNALTGTGGAAYGTYSYIGITNAGLSYGTYNSLNGSTNGDQHGVSNVFGSTGSGNKFGCRNIFLSGGTGNSYGVHNAMASNSDDYHYGTYNILDGTGNGAKYGTFNYVSSNATGTGQKQGCYNFIEPAAGGTHYGVYSNVLKAGSFAGYFLGRVAVGTDWTNTYTMPASRGTNGQIMQTDGAGNVSWVNVPVTADWSLTGNGSTTSGTHFIGTTDAQDVDIRTNNVIRTRITQKGQIEQLNTGQSVFLGENAGDNDDLSANQNVLIGYAAGQSNTTGAYNCAAGYNVLRFNTMGNYNTAIGYVALYSNTSGNSNVAAGDHALYSNTGGDYNAAMGYGALYYNTLGNYNTALGFSTLFSNTSGSDNTAVGRAALYYNTTGFDNAALGRAALSANTTGYYNTACGVNALNGNTTGLQRTAIGYEANTLGTAYNNSTGIGYDADPTAGNRVHIGNTSVTWIGGQVGWSTYSDSAFKRDVNEDVPGLDFITRLRPVTYHYDLDRMRDWKLEHYGECDTLSYPEKYEIETIEFSGFVAQEVQSAASEIDYEFSGVCAPKHEDDFYSLRYAEFVVPLVKAVQELADQNLALRQQVKHLEERIDTLTSP